MIEYADLSAIRGLRYIMDSILRISLAAARVNAGMTQDDVAKKLHVSKQTIVNWERGATQPKIEQGEQLSNLYGIPYQHLIFMPKQTN